MNTGLTRFIKAATVILTIVSAGLPIAAAPAVGKLVSKVAQKIAINPDTALPTPLADDSPINPSLSKPNQKRDTTKVNTSIQTRKTR